MQSHRFAHTAALTLITALAAAPATAAETEAAQHQSAFQISGVAGGGIAYGPAYEGASDYIASPLPLFRLHVLHIPGLLEIGGGPERELSIAPSVRMLGARKAKDYPKLTGLPDIDMAIELGLEISYRREWLRGFVALRQGFGGHHGIVGEAGIDAVFDLSDRLRLTAGPRVGFADGEYMSRYFSVSPAASARSGLAQFKAEPGIRHLGLEAAAEYALTDRWTLHGNAGWHRLVGDAAKSPITKLGDDDQFFVGSGISYKFTIGGSD
ncbi:MAG: MipA/OmpV family protein [Hyphomicrobiales bacterium]|nr:MipA/OmpV family protein [Hyphomicrobiales bacterium]